MLIAFLTFFLSGTVLLKAQQFPPRPFFALCMDTADEKRRTPLEQAEMLKELGFDGIAHVGLEQLEGRIRSCEQYDLKLYQVYFFVDLNAPKPFDVRLAGLLPLLQKHQTQLALLITGGKPSDQSLDNRAVEIIQTILTLCEGHRIKVVLYPHVNNWLESVADCIRIAQRFPDGSIGVMFNLCHWIAIDREEHLPGILDEAKPYLQAVTINGTDMHAMIAAKTGNWLQPLGSGEYDVSQVLKELDRIGFYGPVGLQCYGIPGDAKEHVQQSMNQWKKWTAPKED